MATKEKGTKYKMKKDSAFGTGNTRLPFEEHPDIYPEGEDKGSNPKLEESMFGEEALGSEIPATNDYAPKSKKEYFSDKVFDHKPNTMLPTSEY